MNVVMEQQCAQVIPPVAITLAHLHATVTVALEKWMKYVKVITFFQNLYSL